VREWLGVRRTLRAGIVGGTGYAGAELVRLLTAHPHVELGVITSRTDSGKPVAGVFPNLRGHTNLLFGAPEIEAFENCDVVFYATPHGVAMQSAPALLKAGVRVIDLSGDFRLQDPVVWEHWYGRDHACPEYLAKAVYGLPELNRSAIAEASLIAVGSSRYLSQISLTPIL
jgi:N-acetyl-gamma-glutamyl-phosphate reductase